LTDAEAKIIRCLLDAGHSPGGLVHITSHNLCVPLDIMYGMRTQVFISASGHVRCTGFTKNINEEWTYHDLDLMVVARMVAAGVVDVVLQPGWRRFAGLSGPHWVVVFKESPE